MEAQDQQPFSWKPSTIPSYKGPRKGPRGFAKNGSTPAPFKGHRWLPVRGDELYDIAQTPASTFKYGAFNPALYNWAAAAQTHYSFLTHLERDDAWRYKFDMWDYNYARLSINFLALRGRDIIEVFPFPKKDDEAYLTVVRPRQLGRHVVVDGMGLAAHFSFNPQYTAHDSRGVMWTDALRRYKGFADERICPDNATPIKSGES